MPLSRYIKIQCSFLFNLVIILIAPVFAPENSHQEAAIVKE
jgi:hypothetical protein